MGSQILIFNSGRLQISRHISFVDYCRKHYVSIWIFHSSLFVLHLNMLLTNLLAITPLTSLTPNYNIQQGIWILHSSLFVLHLENTPLTPNNNIPNKTIAKIINK